MEYRERNGITYVSLGGSFPSGARPVRRPASPLVILVRRDPLRSRGFWAISCLGELTEPEGPAALLPVSAPADAPAELEASLAAEFSVSYLVCAVFGAQGRSGGSDHCCFGGAGLRLRPGRPFG